MNLNLNQKVALVCASSKGIGKAIAMGLAKEGAHVALLARDPEALLKTRREIEAVSSSKVISIPCDLSERLDIDRALQETWKQLGPIDILINNQGGPAPGSLHNLTDEQLDSAINTNLRSVIHLSRECLPSMKERKFGRIVNVLSVSGKEPLPGMLLSNMMRPAILGLAKTLATEYAPYGVTINSVLPSAVMTERSTDLLQKRASEQGADFDSVVSNAAKTIPMGRFATPEEFAQLTLFLCSVNASYITGTAHAVDGGTSRGLF